MTFPRFGVVAALEEDKGLRTLCLPAVLASHLERLAEFVLAADRTRGSDLLPVGREVLDDVQLTSASQIPRGA